MVAGHWWMAPALGQLAVDGEIEAHNLPQGVISHLFRETAGKRPGILTRVGLGTFVDPRHGGGKVNDRTTEDLVSLQEIDGVEHLFYRALPVNVALLRGTTADADGNVTMEREALTLESLSIATAVHNSGGLVVVQVERLAEPRSLSPRQVRIPGVLVDCVVLAPAEHHWQTFGTAYAAEYSGEIRTPLGRVPALPLDDRKIISRRAALELRPNAVVNLGLGMPEGIPSVANEEHVLDYLTLTADTGVIGGLPAAGLDFGSAVNAHAAIDQGHQFDFYDGGGLDIAFLGMAEADREGNVNVSRFGPRLAGAGAFINITHSATKIVFMGTFAARGRPKFVEAVEQRTFSGPHAAQAGKVVLYVTERCVFELTERGMELVEVAPGLDVERDVLANMGFAPLVREPREMDPRLFRPELMEIKEELLAMPVEARFSYDPDSNRFFLNLEGLAVRTAAEVRALHAEIDERLARIGRKVDVVVNYDNFHLAPDVSDDYTAALNDLADRHYASVSRYTTSSFLRLKLGGMLTERRVAPHIHESREEAVTFLSGQRR